jgi:hypothetical protein
MSATTLQFSVDCVVNYIFDQFRTTCNTTWRRPCKHSLILAGILAHGPNYEFGFRVPNSCRLVQTKNQSQRSGPVSGQIKKRLPYVVVSTMQTLGYVGLHVNTCFKLQRQLLDCKSISATTANNWSQQYGYIDVDLPKKVTMQSDQHHANICTVRASF